jgi:hypothetical protein
VDAQPHPNVVPKHEESAAGQGNALSGEGTVLRNLQCIHGNRSVDRSLATITRCRVASFLATMLRRTGRATRPSLSIEAVA